MKETEETREAHQKLWEGRTLMNEPPSIEELERAGDKIRAEERIEANPLRELRDAHNRIWIQSKAAAERCVLDPSDYHTGLAAGTVRALNVIRDTMGLPAINHPAEFLKGEQE